MIITELYTVMHKMIILTAYTRHVMQLYTYCTFIIILNKNVYSCNMLSICRNTVIPMYIYINFLGLKLQVFYLAALFWWDSTKTKGRDRKPV